MKYIGFKVNPLELLEKKVEEKSSSASSASSSSGMSYSNQAWAPPQILRCDIYTSVLERSRAYRELGYFQNWWIYSLDWQSDSGYFKNAASIIPNFKNAAYITPNFLTGMGALESVRAASRAVQDGTRSVAKSVASVTQVSFFSSFTA